VNLNARRLANPPRIANLMVQGVSAVAMQESSTRSIYDFHSMFYDVTFGKLVSRRIANAISHMNISPGARVLDLGIGTGASLDYYPRHANIVGIDLSGGMLRECRKKLTQRRLAPTNLFQANALELPFRDDAFDHVFISHVISVVSDPCRLITEAQRVSKPEARIVVLNHFQSTNRLIAMVEKFLCPLCTMLGWRSDLPLQDLIRRTGVEVDYRYKLESIDLWETVVITNNKNRPMRTLSPDPGDRSLAAERVVAA
jgi:phosphatidylethanolamine/phosphatidyl-N-methylethanolamine N-methyltransferase